MTARDHRMARTLADAGNLIYGSLYQPNDDAIKTVISLATNSSRTYTIWPFPLILATKHSIIYSHSINSKVQKDGKPCKSGFILDPQLSYPQQNQSKLAFIHWKFPCSHKWAVSRWQSSMAHQEDNFILGCDVRFKLYHLRQIVLEILFTRSCYVVLSEQERVKIP